jgi:ABC-2 type transport system ATP-binding protein
VSDSSTVEVRDLAMDYGGSLALRGVSFEVGEGEIFGLIGPNGAGKTTTMRVLATLLEPTAGEATVGGYCVQNEAEHVRRVIGYMPDQFGVYDGNTVEEYLEFFAGAYRIPAAKRQSIVRDVMTLTDLTDLKGRMVSSLSRGMKQRLCLAKTLVHDPRVLILDEPASALDPRARVEMRELLKELSRMGKTIIISSHILTELSDLCTSVAILERGQVVEAGSKERLEGKRRGGRQVRVRLLEPRPDVSELLASSSFVGDVRIDGRDVFLEYLGEPEEFFRVVKVLVDAAVPLLSVEQEGSDLERLFMEVTKGDVQ